MRVGISVCATGSPPSAQSLAGLCVGPCGNGNWTARINKGMAAHNPGSPNAHVPLCTMDRPPRQARSLTVHLPLSDLGLVLAVVVVGPQHPNGSVCALSAYLREGMQVTGGPQGARQVSKMLRKVAAAAVHS
jgi:hypothetical protein